MAKFFGKVGFAESVETSPGVWEETIVERDYYGDILRRAIRWDATEYVNDTLRVTNRINIVADDFALKHFSTMRYVTMNGVKWKISTIEVSRPRLVLELGEVWNGD